MTYLARNTARSDLSGSAHTVSVSELDVGDNPPVHHRYIYSTYVVPSQGSFVTFFFSY
jgi:hypothetical protein